MKKLIFLSILFIFAMFAAGMEAKENSQSTDEKFLLWTEYEITPSIIDIAVDETYVWSAYAEGVIRWHKENNTYTYFTEADGLIDKNVTVMEIDNSGNVWFGTPSGLSRFDGSSWTNFTAGNGLSDDPVTSLSLGPNGELLVGSGNSFSIFDGNNWNQFFYDPLIDFYRCLDSGDITDIDIADNGHIWISVPNSITCFFDGEYWNGLTKDGNGVISRQIEFSENGDLWLSGVSSNTGQGILRYEPNGTWHHYTEADGLIDNETTSVTIDNDGDVWVGVYGPLGQGGQGVSRFDGANWTSYKENEGFYGGGVNAILADEAGDIWTAGSNNVSRFQNGSWEAFLSGPPRGGVNEMTFDPNGHLWISMRDSGVVKYDGQIWTQYTKADGLAGDNVKDIIFEDNGTIWFACYDNDGGGGTPTNGLTRFDGTSWVTFTDADGLASNIFENLALDSNGDLWVAHRYGSVDKMTSGGWTNYTTANGLLNERVSTIFTQANLLWMSHSGGYASEPGITLFDGTNWTSFESELPFDKVVDFTIDNNGNLYALSYDGINIYDGSSWIGHAFPDLFPLDPHEDGFTANEIIVDENGQIWVVGSQDLFVFDGIDWKHYSEENTSVSRLTDQIVLDPTNGEIWIDSLDGIVRVKEFILSEQSFLPMIQN